MNRNIDYNEIFTLTRRYGKIKNKSYQCQNNDKTTIRGAYLAVMLSIKRLCCEQNVTTSLVAKDLEMPKSQVSRLLNTLEEQACIRRIHSDRDRREVFIVLTPKGDDVIEKSKNSFIDFINYVYDSIGQEDFEQLIEITKKVEKAIEKRNA